MLIKYLQIFEEHDLYRCGTSPCDTCIKKIGMHRFWWWKFCIFPEADDPKLRSLVVIYTLFICCFGSLLWWWGIYKWGRTSTVSMVFSGQSKGQEDRHCSGESVWFHGLWWTYSLQPQALIRDQPRSFCSVNISTNASSLKVTDSSVDTYKSQSLAEPTEGLSRRWLTRADHSFRIGKRWHARVFQRALNMFMLHCKGLRIVWRDGVAVSRSQTDRMITVIITS